MKPAPQVRPASGQEADDFSTESLPSEWRQWLSYTRTEPPTAEEEAAASHSRRQMELKVAMLEAEELKRQATEAPAELQVTRPLTDPPRAQPVH
jgi:hypothetical protein